MYQPNTNIHATEINVTASSTNAILAIGFSTFVIFQMRCADPLNDSGADITTFSEANWRVIHLFYSLARSCIYTRAVVTYQFKWYNNINAKSDYANPCWYSFT